MVRISEKSRTAVLDGITQPGVKVQAKGREPQLTESAESLRTSKGRLPSEISMGTKQGATFRQPSTFRHESSLSQTDRRTEVSSYLNLTI